MNFYPNIIYWPRNLNRDRMWKWELGARTLSGGRSLSGLTPVARLDGGGTWMAELGDVQVSSPDEVRTWRALAARLDNGATPVVLEARDERFAPWPLLDGFPVTGQYEATNSDGSTCSDGTPYVADVITANLVSNAALRATSLTIELSNHSALRGGEFFSIQHDTFSHRLYRVAKVTQLTQIVPGDDQYTKVLLHFDGADGSTVITDSNRGGSPHIWTANGNAQIDTAQSKFGGASGLFDGSGDYISTPDHADFNLGSGDWTIDCWFNTQVPTGALGFMAGQSDASATTSTLSFWIAKETSNKIRILGYTNGGAQQWLAQTSVSYTDLINPGWHHLAAVRIGNTILLFIDGVLDVGTVINPTGAHVDSSSNLSVGCLGELTSSTWNGWIDEFRISVGIARWTSNFTPPSAPYSSVARYALAIRPPLREATLAGARVELDYPKCIMRLATPEAMDLPLERRLYGQANVKFVEDFPPFDLVEGENQE